MKKTNNNSPMKRIAASATMLAVSAAMLGTSTYAWFTMNKEVKVNGMQLKTKVSGNLLIAESNSSDGNYKTDLTQSRSALLEPASTADGKSFWYTVDASADGNKLAGKNWIEYGEDTTLTNSNAGKTLADYQFNSKYVINGTTEGMGTGDTDAAKWASKINANDMTGFVAPAYGYVDYTFYLKAVTDAANQEINLTKCNLVTQNGSDELAALGANDKAWRIAVFSQTVDEAAAGTGEGSLVTVLAPNGATYQDPSKGVSSATERTAVSKYKSTDAIGSIATANTAQRYKVVVRVWLEGEDTKCTNETYAALTDKYRLDLQFDLQASTESGVSEIGSAITPAAAVTTTYA